MKFKNKNLEFYAMHWNSNKDKPTAINIMRVIDIEKLKKMLKYKGTKPDRYNSIKSYEELRDYLQRQFMYKYWSRCEQEILISGLFSKSKEYKIDVWTQICYNLDIITNYVINELELDFKSAGTKADIHFGLDKE